MWQIDAIVKEYRDKTPPMDYKPSYKQMELLRKILENNLTQKTTVPRDDELFNSKYPTHETVMEMKKNAEQILSTVPKDGEVVEIKKYISWPASFWTCPKCACSNWWLATKCFHCWAKIKRID